MIMRLFSFKLYDYIFSCFRIVWNLREAFLSSNFQLHQIPYYFKGGVSPLPSYIYQFIIKCLDFYNELIWLISNKEHGADNGTLPRSIYALSCIRQKHCRVVTFSRCFVIKGRMASFKVIGVDISSNSSSGFLDVVIQRQISFFILEAAEPSLNHDVVSPTAFSIYNLPFLDLDIPV